jgi:hypothetical protein
MGAMGAMRHQAVILDFVKKSVSYVDVAKATGAAKSSKSVKFSAQPTVPRAQGK